MRYAISILDEDEEEASFSTIKVGRLGDDLLHIRHDDSETKTLNRHTNDLPKHMTVEDLNRSKGSIIGRDKKSISMRSSKVFRPSDEKTIASRKKTQASL